MEMSQFKWIDRFYSQGCFKGLRPVTVSRCRSDNVFRLGGIADIQFDRHSLVHFRMMDDLKT